MSPLQDTFRVAIYEAFFDAFARLPRGVQGKVNKLVRNFRRDPTSAAIDFEKISTFADPNLRTMRVDQTYRAIVLKPQRGDVYVLLWVDHHDDAHAWARDKKFSIHPDTGALQVLMAAPTDGFGAGRGGEPLRSSQGRASVGRAAARDGEPLRSTARPADASAGPGAAGVTAPAAPVNEGRSAAPASHRAPAGPFLAAVRDQDLRRLGVPDAMIADVRALADTAALEGLQDRLPAEAFEALWFLAEGESLADVERSLAAPAPTAPVDTEDFATALLRPDSQRRFFVVDDDAALTAMLDAPLEKWRVFLHPSQRQLVERGWNGPVRVLGGAGTGKTVVAMHRAVWLARHRFPSPDDRILFTTFTRNLAADIRAQLASLCRPDELRRIEVVHLDAWVTDLLKRAGYDYRIDYWKSGGRLEELWERALLHASHDLDVPRTFYRQEWDQVVQPQGCASFADYRSATRQGRGRGLTRAQRQMAWPVFEEYRRLLEQDRLRERDGALRDALTLVRTQRAAPAYRSALVDEAQDMGTVAFELLRAVVPEGPDDLFLVGDGHQRIYARRVVLSHAGVNIVGRSHRLRINYRTTEEIRRWALAKLEGVRVEDLDGGEDSSAGYRSLTRGRAPEVVRVAGLTEQVKVIKAWIEAEGREAKRTCLVARTSRERDRYARELERLGVEVYALKRSEPEDRRKEGLRVATMHRVKGLEFDQVVIAGVEEEGAVLRRAIAEADDAASEEDARAVERALVYVAATRARWGVLVV